MQKLVFGHRGRTTQNLGPIERIGDRTNLLLSVNQERRLLFENALRATHRSPSAFNTIISLGLDGTPNIELLEDTFDEVISRHEILRASFAPGKGISTAERFNQMAEFMRSGTFVPGIFRHSILRCEPFILPLTCLEANGEADERAAIDAIAAHEFKSPFDYQVVPLIRARLIRLGPRRHVLIIILPHLISDELSLDILRREIPVIYTALLNNASRSLAEPQLSFSDFAAWQHKYLNGPGSGTALLYWKNQWLGLELGATPLRTLLRASHHGAAPIPCQIAMTIDGYLAEDLRKYARKERVTVAMLFLASFARALHAATGERRIGVWVALANRIPLEVQRMFGWFVNSHLVCIEIKLDQTAGDLLTRVRNTVLDAIRYQGVPTPHLWRTIRYTPSVIGRVGSVKFNYRWEESASTEYQDKSQDCFLRFFGTSALQYPRLPVQTLDASVMDKDGQFKLALNFDETVLSKALVKYLLQCWFEASTEQLRCS